MLIRVDEHWWRLKIKFFNEVVSFLPRVLPHEIISSVHFLETGQN